MFASENYQKTGQRVEPPCAIFGLCGGCQYQDMHYDDELRLKENSLKHLFQDRMDIVSDFFTPIVPSPMQYHYRHRLDLKLVKFRNPDQPQGQEILMGFSPSGRNRLIPADNCAIAMRVVSEFLPNLKKESMTKLSEKYRQANLVIKTGDDGRVVWGGIGRHSLRMKEEDYLWTSVKGKKIFYSLDTFFQANLSILPVLITEIENLNLFNRETVLYDLYGGVGLFSICFYDRVEKVVLIEENVHAIKLAQYNAQYHQTKNFNIVAGKAEEQLVPAFDKEAPYGKNAVAIIDPPRQGLSQQVCELLCESREKLNALLYLSCNPSSLVDDLKLLTASVWQIEKIIPFDFFPRTQHIETLVIMKSKGRNPHENR